MRAIRGIRLFCLLLAGGFPIYGQDNNGTWTNASGNWSDSTKWASSVIANGATKTADLSIDYTNPSKVLTLDSARSIGIIDIGDTNTTDHRTLTLAASGGFSLTMDNGANAAVINQHSNSLGDTISAPLILASNLTVTNSSGTASRTLKFTTGGITASASPRTITIGGSAAGGITMSGVIGNGTGSISIIKNNSSNALTLSGLNTFTGGITLNAGQINVDNGGTNSTASALGTGALTIAGGSIGSTAGSAVTVATNNVQTWSGDFGFAGTQSLNLGTGDVTLTANRQISIGSTSDTLTIAGIIDDGANDYSITTVNTTANTATGILALSGANTYSGGTTINGGVVRFVNASAIPSVGTITVNNGGALSVSGAFATLAGALAEPRLATTSTGTLALTADSSEDFNPGAAGYHTLGLGAQVGASVTYTGTITPSSINETYFVGGGGGSIIFSNANAFTGTDKKLTVLSGGGAVVITNSNDYTGVTTIGAGSTLQIGNATASGSINGTSAITNNGTLTFDRSDAISFGKVISGSGALIKRNLNTLTLSAASNYTGPTTINGGGLKIGVLNALPTGTNLTLGNGTVPANLDLSDFSQTVASLTITHHSTSATSTTTIGEGKTLSVTGTGGLVIGVPNTNSRTTNAVMTGSGTLDVNNVSANIDIGLRTADQGDTQNNTSLNLANLGAFKTNVNDFRVGYDAKNAAVLTLSNTSNQITANKLWVSHSGTNNSAPASVILGTGANVIDTDEIILGYSKGNGTLKFASQTAGSPGSVTITGKTTAGTNFIIASSSSTGTSALIEGLLDLRGHEANVTAGSIVLGRRTDSGAGNAIANLYLEDGALTVGSFDIANKSGTGSGNANGNLNISGGTVTVNTSFQLAKQVGSGSATGSLNITGGTVISNVDVIDGGGTTTTNITLDGGVFDLKDHNIGSATNIINSVSLLKGTLQNVKEINGGAPIAKTGGGTLTLAGTNTYTGATNVDAGKLIVAGSTVAASAFNVTGATLAGTGSIGGTVAVNAGGHLAPGTAGNDLGTGTVTFAASSFYDAILNTQTLQADRTTINGNLNLAGLPTLTLADLGGDLRVPDNTVFTLISYTGAWDNGIFSGYANNSTVNFGANEFKLKYDDTDGVTSAVTLTSVPEPAAVGLLAVAAIGMLRRRSR